MDISNALVAGRIIHRIAELWDETNADTDYLGFFFAVGDMLHAVGCLPREEES